jgi:hypothetical protein
MPLGGVYTGNISYMVSGTGAISEYLCGRIMRPPSEWERYAVVLRMKMRFKIRDKMTVVLVLLGF